MIMEERFFIGRTTSYYETNEDVVFVEDTWTWSEDEDDKDFAGEIYELNDVGVSELDWWIRCRQMNQYVINHSFNVDSRNQEQLWSSLICKSLSVRFNNDTYFFTKVDATDGLDMASKLQPSQICRYFDKYVYRTSDGKAMACYVNDVFNNWSV